MKAALLPAIILALVGFPSYAATTLLHYETGTISGGVSFDRSYSLPGAGRYRAVFEFDETPEYYHAAGYHTRSFEIFVVDRYHSEYNGWNHAAPGTTNLSGTTLTWTGSFGPDTIEWYPDGTYQANWYHEHAVDFTLYFESPNAISYELSITAIPEPATWLMMIAGFGMVGSAVRRRDKSPRITHAAA